MREPVARSGADRARGGGAPRARCAWWRASRLPAAPATVGAANHHRAAPSSPPSGPRGIEATVALREALRSQRRRRGGGGCGSAPFAEAKSPCGVRAAVRAGARPSEAPSTSSSTRGRGGAEVGGRAARRSCSAADLRAPPRGARRARSSRSSTRVGPAVLRTRTGERRRMATPRWLAARAAAASRGVGRSDGGRAPSASPRAGQRRRSGIAERRRCRRFRLSSDETSAARAGRRRRAADCDGARELPRCRRVATERRTAPAAATRSAPPRERRGAARRTRAARARPLSASACAANVAAASLARVVRISMRARSRTIGRRVARRAAAKHASPRCCRAASRVRRLSSCGSAKRARSAAKRAAAPRRDRRTGPRRTADAASSRRRTLFAEVRDYGSRAVPQLHHRVAPPEPRRSRRTWTATRRTCRRPALRT